MTPRSYRMDRRAAQVEAVREQILRAAIALYVEQGIRETTFAQVARRADVAPRTVANHFRTSETLVGAALDLVMADLVLPDAARVARAETRAGRARAMVREILAFYDRSTAWYEAFRGELALPVVARAEARFRAALEPVYRAGVGDALDDRVLRGRVIGFLHPATLGALREAGLSLDEAIDAVTEVIVGSIDAGPDGGGR